MTEENEVEEQEEKPEAIKRVKVDIKFYFRSGLTFKTTAHVPRSECQNFVTGTMKSIAEPANIWFNFLDGSLPQKSILIHIPDIIHVEISPQAEAQSTTPS